jgi:probable HAF family extracellular repeat protein
VLAAMGLAACGTLFADYTYQTIDVPGSYATNLEDINNHGVVAGYYGAGSGNLGFTYDPGSHLLLTLYGPAGASDIQALAINDNGDVAGTYRDANNVTHGFIYSNGGYTTIDGPGAAYGTYLTGINNSGQLALSYTSTPANVAHRWTPDGHGGYTIQDFSVPGSLTTATGGIDNSGNLVGYYQTPNYGGYLWRSGGTNTTFNHPNDGGTTQALGINDNGDIVGAYFGTSHITGYLRTNGGFADIDPPGSSYSYATGINNDGQIAGWYFTGQNFSQAHGFVATVIATPEPAAWQLVGLCAGLLLIRRRG